MHEYNLPFLILNYKFKLFSYCLINSQKHQKRQKLHKLQRHQQLRNRKWTKLGMEIQSNLPVNLVISRVNLSTVNQWQPN